MAKTRAPRAAASWIAVVPMPEVPPWTRKVSPACRRPRPKTLVQTVKKVSQSAAGRAHVERARHRQRVVLVGQRVFGIAAAGQQRGDRVADLPGRAAGADGGDLAGDLEPGQVRGAGRRRVGAARAAARRAG